MELKRTARNIAGNNFRFPGHSFLNMSSRAAVGSSFAEAIMSKYQPVDEYGLPSASFVYYDPEKTKEEEEQVLELINELSVLNRMNISVLNQSYEKKYYIHVKNHCDQLLFSLKQSAFFDSSVRTLDKIYKEIEKRASLTEKSVLKVGKDARPEQRETISESGRITENGVREAGKEIWLETERKLKETGKLVEDRMRILAVRTGNAGLAGHPRPYAGQPAKGQDRGFVPEKERTEKIRPASRGKRIGTDPGRSMTVWASEQAKMFFWRVQRASRWEQQIIFRAMDVASLSELSGRLRGMKEEVWRQSASYFRENVENLLKDREFLETVFYSAAGMEAEFLENQVRPDAAGKIKEETVLVKENDGNENAAYRGRKLETERSFLEISRYFLKDADEVEPEEQKREFLELVKKDRLEESILGLLSGEEEREGRTDENEPLWYPALLDAVTYLDQRQWKAFKEELFSLEEGKKRPDAVSFLPVIQWIRSQREAEKERIVIVEEEAAAGAASEEKRALLSAFMEQKRQGAEEMEEILKNSRVLSEYFSWEDNTPEERLHDLVEEMDEAAWKELKEKLIREVVTEETPREVKESPAALETEEGTGKQQEKGSVRKPFPAAVLEGLLEDQKQEERSRYYRLVEEAVSRLGMEEWETLRTELFTNGTVFYESEENEELHSPVLKWMLAEKEKEEKALEGGEKRERSPMQMSKEKEAFLLALRQQTEIKNFYEEKEYAWTEETLRKSRVLSEHIRWEDVYQTEETNVRRSILASAVLEGIQGVRKWEERNRYYRLVEEAVSYLGMEEWETLRTELFANGTVFYESKENEELHSPVLKWTLAEKEKEEKALEGGEKRERSPMQMSEEKEAFLLALRQQTEIKNVYEEKEYAWTEETLRKSRILSGYIRWEDVFQKENRFESEELRQFESVMKTLTNEEWSRLETELEKITEAAGEDFTEESVVRLIREGLKRETVQEDRSRYYRALERAVSHLEQEEWSLLKTELFQESQAYIEDKAEEDLSAPVLRWIQTTGEKEKTDVKKGRESLEPESEKEPEDVFRSEKEERKEFLRVLKTQIEAGVLYSEKEWKLTEEILKKNRILTERLETDGQAEYEEGALQTEHGRPAGSYGSLPELSEEQKLRLGAEIFHISRKLWSDRISETDESLFSLQEAPEKEWERNDGLSALVHRENAVEKGTERTDREPEDGASSLEKWTKIQNVRREVLELAEKIEPEEWEQIKANASLAAEGLFVRLAGREPEAEMERRTAAGLFHFVKDGSRSGREIHEKIAEELSGIRVLREQIKTFAAEYAENKIFAPRHVEKRIREQLRLESRIFGEEILPETVLKSASEVSSFFGKAFTAITEETQNSFWQNIFEKGISQAETLFLTETPAIVQRKLIRSADRIPWLSDGERGVAAAVHAMEQMRQKRIRNTGEELSLPYYDSASLVISQSAAQKERREASEQAKTEKIRHEVEKQVKEQTTDIQFITQTQTVSRETESSTQTDLKNLIRQVEEQQKELEEMKKKQAAFAKPQDMSQISRAVMKKMRGQLHMDQLRHGI